MSYGVGRRRGSDPELLWLWCRLAAGPLAWEPPYATDAALKRQKDRKEGTKEEREGGKEGRKKEICAYCDAGG